MSVDVSEELLEEPENPRLGDRVVAKQANDLRFHIIPAAKFSVPGCLQQNLIRSPVSDCVRNGKRQLSGRQQASAISVGVSQANFDAIDGLMMQHDGHQSHSQPFGVPRVIGRLSEECNVPAQFVRGRFAIDDLAELLTDSVLQRFVAWGVF